MKKGNVEMAILMKEDTLCGFRKVGGYLKGQAWTEEAETVKKMIKKNEPDAKVSTF